MNTIWCELLGEPFTSGYLDAGGIRTRYVEAGHGPTAILLHGRGGHLENWIKNIAPLAKHFRVIAIDMMGHGFSAKPEADYTITRYASHVEAVLNTIGADRVSLVGQSLGGWVGAWLTYCRPDLVDRLILVNTNGFRPIPPDIVKKIRASSKAAVEQLTFETMRERLRPLVLKPELISDELVRIRLAIYGQPEMRRILDRVMGAELEPARQQEFELTRDRLERIRARTMVIWTTHDPLCSWQEAEAHSKQIADSEFHVLNDCAHWPQYEQPEEFNGLVAEFLKRN